MKHAFESLGLLVFSMFTVTLAACGDDGGSGTGGQGGTTASGGQAGSTGGQGGTTASGGQAGSTGGQGGSTGGCHTTAECPGGEGCVGPEDTFCGVPPQEECQSNADCPNGNVCHSMPDGCSPDKVGSRCGAPCVADADCGDAKYYCGPGGSCAPAACALGGDGCLAVETCDPATFDPNAPPSSRSSGCKKITCAADADCPTGGVCVNAYCQTGIGDCKPPAP